MNQASQRLWVDAGTSPAGRVTASAQAARTTVRRLEAATRTHQKLAAFDDVVAHVGRVVREAALAVESRRSQRLCLQRDLRCNLLRGLHAEAADLFRHVPFRYVPLHTCTPKRQISSVTYRYVPLRTVTYRDIPARRGGRSPPLHTVTYRYVP